MEDTIIIPWYRRVWHSILAVFSPTVRELTPEERRLQGLLATAHDHAAMLGKQIDLQAKQIDKLQHEADLHKIGVQGLQTIIATHELRWTSFIDSDEKPRRGAKP